MNEEQQQPPSINEQVTSVPVTDWKHTFTTVTPLSRILAVILFITLPFVGFWLGMEYGALERSVQRIEQPINVPITEQQEPRPVAYVPQTWSITPSEVYPYTASIDANSLVSSSQTFTISGTMQGINKFGLNISDVEGNQVYATGHEDGASPSINVEKWNVSISSPVADGVYQVSIYGPGEVTLAWGVLTVGIPPLDPFTSPSIVSFFAGPGNAFVFGDSGYLRWGVKNATACLASGDWSGSKYLLGSFDLINIDSQKSYTLTCTGPGGEVSKTLLIDPFSNWEEASRVLRERSTPPSDTDIVESIPIVPTSY